MPFGRTAETELGLHGAGLSFASIIGSIVLFCAMSFAILTFTSRRLTSAQALSSAFKHVKLTIKHSHVYGCDVKPGAALDACYGMFLFNPTFRTLSLALTVRTRPYSHLRPGLTVALYFSVCPAAPRISERRYPVCALHS